MPTKNGYTLVELLIVITITTVLITIGVSAYRKASDIQTTKNATEVVLATLTGAQKSATSGRNDCSGIYLGETINLSSGSPTMTITSTCQSSSGTPRQVTLSGYSFASTTTLIMRPLNQGIDTGVSDPIYLDYTGSGGTYRVQVNRSGTIKSLGKITQ